MTTLTGFEDHHETPEEWRAYIRQLQDRCGELVKAYEALKAERRPTNHERIRFLSRYGLLSEHIDRAECELK